MLLSLLRSGSVDMLSVIVYILSVLMVVFLINPLHECAHGFVAYKLGDRTAKNSGRLTLNPISHIDYFGAAMMLIVGFGWAKPVPVNPRNFKKPKLGMGLTALAGPVSNLLAAILGGLIYNGLLTLMLKNGGITFEEHINYTEVVFHPEMLKYVLMFLQFFILINICLAVFNLIPVPPLDGSKILMMFLPNRTIYKIQRYEHIITLAVVTWVDVQLVIEHMSRRIGHKIFWK